MGDQLILSVTVSGDQSSLPSPRLPPVDSFSVYDSGRSQSLNFVNGQVSASAVYTYVLSPRSVGQYKIPPITADGAAVPTPPLDVEVVAPGHQPTPTSVPSPSGPSTAKNATRSPRNADVFNERLGHTPWQVTVGTLSGVAITYLLTMFLPYF